jgi:hypothetical protein
VTSNLATRAERADDGKARIIEAGIIEAEIVEAKIVEAKAVQANATGNEASPLLSRF